ncbi:MAG: AsmA family protein, partial [Alphaproteobacteria bacterium]|nr:AsmA family protein [Alphaproteobacteria bacterium]
MKRLGIFLAILFVVVAAGVLALPSLIDWNEYKGEIARRLEAAIGRDVVIEGDLSLSLLPTPTLSADEVAIANVKGGSASDMVTLRSLRLELALAPLFAGEVRIVSLVLVEPVIQLEETASGQRNWELGEQRSDATGEPPRDDQGGGGSAIALERMTIENGRLVYLRPEAQAIALDAIDAAISAESLQGPFKVVGQAGFRGRPLSFEVSAGRLVETPVPLTVSIKLPAAGAEGKLSGQIREQDGARSFKGRLAVAGNSLAAALGALGAEARTLPQAMSGAFQIEGNLLAAGAQASLDDMSLRIGESQGTGGVAVLLDETPQVDLALAFNRFDLDDWLSGGKDFKPVKTAPVTERKAAPPLPERGDSEASLRLLPPERKPAEERGPQPFALPDGVLVNLDLHAESVVVRKALVRQARLNAALSGGVLTLNQASAQLPGGTEVGLFGLLTTRGGQPHLEGDIETSSDNLRAALEWMGVDVSTVPADRLRKFAASGHVEGRPDEIQVSKLDVRLDTSRVDGALIVRPMGRLAFSANLVLDSLNLDAYRGREATPAAAPAPQSPPPPESGGLSALGEVDANVRLRLGQITLGGVAVQDAQIEATLMGGDLTLREAKASDVAGAELRLAGLIRDLPGNPSLDGLEYDLRSDDPAKLMRLLGAQGPTRLNDLALAGVLNGTLERLEVRSRSKAAGATLVADGVLSGLPMRPRYDFAIEAEHPNIAALARSLTDGFRPASGPFAL